MQLKEFYQVYLRELKKIYAEGEAAAICNLVFEQVAKADRKLLLTHPGRMLEDVTLNHLHSALEKLKAGIPVQYVLGETIFFNLIFKVNPAVLIPRPETEELVNEALQFIRIHNKQTIIDIGTGSGCIPISIKRNEPGVKVSAVEFSEPALALAKENGAINGTEITWILMDFLNEKNWTTLPLYDVIISNPPYIPLSEKEVLDKNVTQHEPALALFVPDDDPLLFYREIAAFGKHHLGAGGKIFMEVHESYAPGVAELFIHEAYEATIIKDFFEKDRIVTATRCR
jgi:release factor glutamine methyltransferase